jgi:hypothetical protein
MQVEACAHCATNRIYQGIISGYTKTCPTCQTVAPLVIAPREWCESVDNFQARAFAALEPAPVEAAQPKAKRCAHYGQIKEFFAVAREMGYDTSKASQDRWRGSIGMLIGRPVASRSELSGAEWNFATSALRMGRLFI